MYWKKAMAAVLILLAITACTNKAIHDDLPQGSGDQVTLEEQVPELMFAFIGDSSLQDIHLVEEEVNAISIEKIGAKVKMLPIARSEYNQKCGLMLARNETIDLMMVMGSLDSYIFKDQLLPLDHLVEQHGADILEAEGIAISGGLYGGTLYAIPSEEKLGRSYGIVARADLLRQHGIDVTGIEGYRDLESVFEQIVEHEPDMIPFVAGAGASRIFFEIDALGATLASGCLMDGGSTDTTIVNFFATPEYAAFVKDMYCWNQKGFMVENVITNTKSGAELVKNGKAFSFVMSTELDMAGNTSNTTGYEMTAIPVTRDYATTSMYQMSMWAIPFTSNNPEKAMEFLNLTYCDERLVNLLSSGIEGMHYEKTEQAMVIRRPDGVTSQNSGYEMPGSVFGNKMLKYAWESAGPPIFDQINEYNARVLETGASKALGYVFDAANVRAEVLAVTEVLEQYQLILETGSSDPDITLPLFLSKLEAAGIDRVIAENQRQLDAWLAGH